MSSQFDNSQAMPKKFYIAIALLVIVIVCLLAWSRSGTREPVYNGRTVSSWLEGHVASSSANPPFNSPGWLEADTALRKVGTNAIPVLLKQIAAKDYPKWVIKVWIWAANHQLLRPYRHAFNQNEEALYAFKLLGKNAAPAVPELTRIYERNMSWSSKDCAAWALGAIGSPAQSALPALLRDFSSTNWQERFDAVSSVMQIGGPSNIVFPALLSAAKDPDVNIRWNAIVGLSKYGGRARVAVPMLMDALHDPAKVGGSPITEAVETALWRIAPEIPGKPLVITEDSSMTNGARTVCSIDIQAQGKRKTTIPAGKTVPYVGDFWNNEPPATIVVYRSGPEKNQETSLGEFEIKNLPGLEENVSLVCVVANGKIILNARDNNAEKFLEIRKVK